MSQRKRTSIEVLTLVRINLIWIFSIQILGTETVEEQEEEKVLKVYYLEIIARLQ